jgi:hypothetical protein
VSGQTQGQQPPVLAVDPLLLDNGRLLDDAIAE